MVFYNNTLKLHLDVKQLQIYQYLFILYSLTLILVKFKGFHNKFQAFAATRLNDILVSKPCLQTHPYQLKTLSFTKVQQ